MATAAEAVDESQTEGAQAAQADNAAHHNTDDGADAQKHVVDLLYAAGLISTALEAYGDGTWVWAWRRTLGQMLWV